jgi:PAS domain S-box-containing protein
MEKSEINEFIIQANNSKLKYISLVALGFSGFALFTDFAIHGVWNNEYLPAYKALDIIFTIISFSSVCYFWLFKAKTLARQKAAIIGFPFLWLIWSAVITGIDFSMLGFSTFIIVVLFITFFLFLGPTVSIVYFSGACLALTITLYFTGQLIRNYLSLIFLIIPTVIISVLIVVKNYKNKLNDLFNKTEIEAMNRKLIQFNENLEKELERRLRERTDEIRNELAVRKQAEDALKNAEIKFHTLFDTTRDSVMLMDENGFMDCNHAALNMFGCESTKEFCTKHFTGLSAPVQPNGADTMAQINQHFNKAMEKGTDLFDWICVRADTGETFQAEVLLSRMELHGKQVLQATARDITERKRVEERIQKDLKEKEVMLKEIHHRVRNNLNVITSMLNLQTDRITTKRQALDAFEETKNRIYAMALVHSNLYEQEDFSRIDLKSFVQSLIQNLALAYRTDVQIDVHIEDMQMDLGNAVPCGLILNELATNALKHAFREKLKGLIAVDFRILKDNTFELTVQDNGIGLPEAMDVHNAKSLGLVIVNQLVAQIDGALKITRGGGTCFQIRFPVSGE